MSVNYCDGFMFASVPAIYPYYAANGAASAGAGWASLTFAPVGLAIGIGAVCFGRPVVYAVMKLGMDHCEAIRRKWLKECLFLPFAIWYFLAPWCFIGSGAWASYSLCEWAAARIF